MLSPGELEVEIGRLEALLEFFRLHASATCGTAGVGPLLTWQELNVHRWGCFGVPNACPRNRQNTVLGFLSPQTNVADTIVTAPSIELGTYMAITCPLGAAQQSAAGTLNVVTAKNRGTNTALHSTFTVTSGATAVGQLVVNTSRSNSRASIVTTGGLLTQPLSPVTIPVTTAFFPTLTEVDTWAHGDNFVAYTPIARTPSIPRTRMGSGARSPSGRTSPSLSPPRPGRSL